MRAGRRGVAWLLGRLLGMPEAGTAVPLVVKDQHSAEELAWLERDRPYPANLAPLLRAPVRPGLQPLARLLAQDVHTVPTGQ